MLISCYLSGLGGLVVTEKGKCKYTVPTGVPLKVSRCNTGLLATSEEPNFKYFVLVPRRGFIAPFARPFI